MTLKASAQVSRHDRGKIRNGDNHTGHATPVADAYESLCAQEMPDGWTWEWLVQEDGRSGEVAAALPDDSRVLSGTGKPGGPGTARNMAMARSSGDLLRVLDADDRLTPGALAVLPRDVGQPGDGW
jgi:glycosyltransferase involved in cell wall biosynthesis